MRVKSNIEHNIVQIATLAICPLLIVLNNLSQAFFFIFATCICYFISALLCKVLNKYLGKNLKVFLTAIVSTIILTILNYIIGKHNFMGLEEPEDSYYAILAVICLCLDTYFIDKRADRKPYIIKVLFDCVYFAVMLLILSVVVEFLGFGTIFKLTVFTKFTGSPFFASMSFKFLFLGIISFAVDTSYRARQAKANEKKMTLEKYVKKSRDEKFFQYDSLRRQKLLSSKIIVNNVNDEKAIQIEQLLNENESVETEEEKKQYQEEEEKNKKLAEEKAEKKAKATKERKAGKKFKDSIEEKAKVEKPKKEKKKKEEKLKGSVRGAKVERVFINPEDSEDSETGEDKK